MLKSPKSPFAGFGKPEKMGRVLKPPRVTKAAELDAKRMAKLTDPEQIATLAAKAQRRLDRANRFAAQVQRQAELQAKREAQARAKALKDERLATQAELQAQAEAKRQARADRLAEIESRRQARLERKLAKEAKWAARAEREEKAYQWRQRKAEIADYKAHRRTYLDEIAELKRTNPWKLVLMQDDVVDLAYRRQLQLKLDARGAKAVMGADDPETVQDWRRAEKAFESAKNSWQHEKRRLKKLTLEARAFDLDQTAAET